MRRLAMISLLVMFAVGAAYAGAVDVDFNPKADFQNYRTWAFAPGREQGQRGVLADATMRERVEKALAVRLNNAGLRPAASDATPDLLVTYRGDTGTGKEVVTSQGGLRSMDNPAYASIQFTEQTATLMVDLVDASTKTLAWRLYLDQTVKGPNDPPDKLQKALDKGFAKYPPSASAIAKKTRQLEKAAR
jgi:Domain of unknown function (DUF4136)